MSAARASAADECEYKAEHPAMRERLAGLEDRVERLEERDKSEKGELFELVRGIDRRLSNLEGRMIGYLASAGFIGAAGLLVARSLLAKIAGGGAVP